MAITVDTINNSELLERERAAYSAEQNRIMQILAAEKLRPGEMVAWPTAVTGGITSIPINPYMQQAQAAPPLPTTQPSPKDAQDACTSVFSFGSLNARVPLPRRLERIAGDLCQRVSHRDRPLMFHVDAIVQPGLEDFVDDWPQI